MDGDAPGPSRPSIIAGQLVASTFTAFFVTYFVADAISDGVNERGELALAVVLAFASLSVVVAWLDVTLGPRLLLAAGLAMATFGALAAGSSRAAVAIIFGAPYLLSAAAVWFGARRLAGRAVPDP